MEVTVTMPTYGADPHRLALTVIRLLRASLTGRSSVKSRTAVPSSS